MVTKDIYSPCIVDWDFLNKMGCGETVEEIVDSFIWRKAVEIKENVYREWCFEFFSTVKVKKEIADTELFTEGIMKFRLGGTEHTVKLMELGRLLGVYSEEEVGSENFKKLVAMGERKNKNFDGDKYWEEISGQNVKVFGKKESGRSGTLFCKSFTKF